MAALTHLDEKLAEVLGLAQAAKAAAKKVGSLARAQKDTELVALMGKLGEDSTQLADRCQKAADTRAGMKSAITKKAAETRGEVGDFMKTYLQDAEALDGLEFLSMSEAGEMAHWEILSTLNETAKDKDIRALVAFAVPLQRKHVEAVREHALRLAAEEDPSEES